MFIYVYNCLYHISSYYIPPIYSEVAADVCHQAEPRRTQKMTNDRAVQAQATRSLGQENHEEDHLGIFPPESLGELRARVTYKKDEDSDRKKYGKIL